MRSREYKHLYNKNKWKKLSKEFIYYHPICVYCGSMATVTNHKKPHKGNETLFWDSNNWEPVCKPCHDSVVAKIENGKVNGKDFVINNVSDNEGLPVSGAHPWNKGAG